MDSSSSNTDLILPQKILLPVLPDEKSFIMMSWHTFDPSTSSTGWHGVAMRLYVSNWQWSVIRHGAGLDSGFLAIGEWDRVRKELIVDARTITCPHEILYLFVCVVEEVGGWAREVSLGYILSRHVSRQARNTIASRGVCQEGLTHHNVVSSPMEAGNCYGYDIVVSWIGRPNWILVNSFNPWVLFGSVFYSLVGKFSGIL